MSANTAMIACVIIFLSSGLAAMCCAVLKLFNDRPVIVFAGWMAASAACVAMAFLCTSFIRI
jgi:hypothetical protein